MFNSQVLLSIVHVSISRVGASNAINGIVSPFDSHKFINSHPNWVTEDHQQIGIAQQVQVHKEVHEIKKIEWN